ncbi:MAG TPA: cytochrome c [Acidimicrobiia bacterium]
MSRWTEGVLALIVVLAFGLAMQLFTGDTPGPGGGNDNPEPTTPTVPPDPEAAARGQAVMETAGCLLCHTVDGSRGSAPTFKGLAGASRPLETGEFVTADDAYILNSIIDPSSQIVQGYGNLMPPNFEETLTPDQINDIIAYIKSLSS